MGRVQSVQPKPLHPFALASGTANKPTPEVEGETRITLRNSMFCYFLFYRATAPVRTMAVAQVPFAVASGNYLKLNEESRTKIRMIQYYLKATPLGFAAALLADFYLCDPH